MARLVKCVYCEKTINRDIEEFLQTPQKRYAHIQCDLEHQKEQKHRKELESYMIELLGDNINFGMLYKQIKNYQDDYGFSISGILGTVHYIVTVEGLNFSKSQGIGLVPYYYNKAKIYWARVKAANEAAQEIDYKLIKKEVYINPPQTKPLIKQKPLSLSELEEEINNGI